MEEFCGDITLRFKNLCPGISIFGTDIKFYVFLVESVTVKITSQFEVWTINKVESYQIEYHIFYTYLFFHVFYR